MTNNATIKQYIKDDIFKKTGMNRLAMFYMICYYIMPQYFGIELGFFDLTAQRIAMIVVLLYILSDRNRISCFIDEILNFKYLIHISIYLLITLYTAVYRINVGTFMYPLIEVINIFIIVFMIKNTYGLQKFTKIIQIFVLILCIHGLIESVLGFSIFSKMITIKGTYAGAMVRSGAYRIMGPCNHSLAYGLLLITATPFICINVKSDRINLLEHKLTIVLVLVNVFLTGSRSSLAIFLLELFLIFLFSDSINKKKTFIVVIVSILTLAILVIAFYGSGFSNYILLQVTSILDEVFDTQLSINYGANFQMLKNSSTYRSYLPQIFVHESLNPFIGRGTGYSFSWFVDGYLIQSIDNFYVQTYIQYSYPGLIVYCFFIFSPIILMVKTWIKRKSGIAGCLFIGSACYFLNLWWVDTLQTIKYYYIILAFFCVYYLINYHTKTDSKEVTSKYFR